MSSFVLFFIAVWLPAEYFFNFHVRRHYKVALSYYYGTIWWWQHIIMVYQCDMLMVASHGVYFSFTQVHNAKLLLAQIVKSSNRKSICTLAWMSHVSLLHLESESIFTKLRVQFTTRIKWCIWSNKMSRNKQRYPVYTKSGENLLWVWDQAHVICLDLNFLFLYSVHRWLLGKHFSFYCICA